MSAPAFVPKPAHDASRVLEGLSWTGSDLHRPECVLATRSGDLYVSDWRGGVTRIRPDGLQASFLAPPVDGEALKPNGIALLADGSFLLAHLGAERGGVFHLTRDGRVMPFLERADGTDLHPTNFVVQDRAGRTWVTVSTRRMPRSLGYRRDCDDGYVVLVDERGSARIVADGLGYTNECALDAEEKWLYVNETFARRLSRFPIAANGSLGARQVVTEFGAGVFPDGLCFDAEGGLWVTSIVSNRVLRVAPDGRCETWLDDSDAAHVAEVEKAYAADAMGRPHLDQVRSRKLSNISSLAFGGADLGTGHLGCILGDRVATIRMPVAGLAPVHWNFPGTSS